MLGILPRPLEPRRPILFLRIAIRAKENGVGCVAGVDRLLVGLITESTLAHAVRVVMWKVEVELLHYWSPVPFRNRAGRFRPRARLDVLTILFPRPEVQKQPIFISMSCPSLYFLSQDQLTLALHLSRAYVHI